VNYIPAEFWESLPPEALDALEDTSSRLAMPSGLFEEEAQDFNEGEASARSDSGNVIRPDDMISQGNAEEEDDEEDEEEKNNGMNMDTIRSVVNEYEDNTDVLTNILEQSLVRGLCHAYRAFYKLYECFPGNDIVIDLFGKLNKNLGPTLRHVYKHAAHVHPNSEEFIDVLHTTLSDLSTTRGDRIWLPPLGFENVRPIIPSSQERKKDRPRTLFTDDQREQLCKFCTVRFSRFVKSFEKEVVYSTFTRRLVESPIFAQLFKSEANDNKVLRLDEMMPKLHEHFPEDYEELKNLYDGMMSAFAFMRIIYSGTREPAYRRLLKLLFEKLGSSVESGNESPFGHSMFKKVMSIAENDEQLQQLKYTMDRRNQREFQGQLTFLFTHFSNTGILADMMQSPAMKELQTITQSMPSA
jgi:hypothetical protein